jgi:DNA-directed RNA polymerase II subunit RPB3
VAVATFMYEPIITLNQAVLSTYTPEQKAELYKSCPTEVYETDENYELVWVRVLLVDGAKPLTDP